MGYSMTPYAVDLRKITAVVNSKDESLLKLLTKKFEVEFDNIDALGDDYADDDEEEKEEEEEEEDGKQEVKKTRGVISAEEALLMMKEFLLNQDSPEDAIDGDQDEEEDAAESRPPCASTAEALRHLIMGEPFDRRVGFKYGYVLENLCRHFGEMLPHDNWCDLRSCHHWFDELDDTLRLAGVPAETLSINGLLCGRGSPIRIPKINDFPSIGYLQGVEIERALGALREAKIDDIGEEEEEEAEPWLPEGLDEVRGWLRTCAESKRDLVCFYC